MSQQEVILDTAMIKTRNRERERPGLSLNNEM